MWRDSQLKMTIILPFVFRETRSLSRWFLEWIDPFFYSLTFTLWHVENTRVTATKSDLADLNGQRNIISICVFGLFNFSCLFTRRRWCACVHARTANEWKWCTRRVLFITYSFIYWFWTFTFVFTCCVFMRTDAREPIEPSYPAAFLSTWFHFVRFHSKRKGRIDDEMCRQLEMLRMKKSEQQSRKEWYKREFLMKNYDYTVDCWL